MELRDAHQKFIDARIKVYAISYDSIDALADFSNTHGIAYPLLSDVDSSVIQSYGILNTEIDADDIPIHGVPFPGTYITDEHGIVVAKFFHDSYKKRDSPENLIDAALGRIELDAEEPAVSGGDDDVRVSATLHGGHGAIKQGMLRSIVVRFELRDGLHIYGEPVPEGMIPTTVRVNGPRGLVVLDPLLPPTETLRLESLGIELQVWSGTVDLQIPIYALSELASECRPLEKSSVDLDIRVRYQACDDSTCLLPRTENLSLQVPLDTIDVPPIGRHTGHGQKEGGMISGRHLRRLLFRKLRSNPLGMLRGIRKQVRLERAARARLKRARSPADRA